MYAMYIIYVYNMDMYYVSCIMYMGSDSVKGMVLVFVFKWPNL